MVASGTEQRIKYYDVPAFLVSVQAPQTVKSHVFALINVGAYIGGRGGGRGRGGAAFKGNKIFFGTT